MELIKDYLIKIGFKRKVDNFCIYYEKDDKRVYLNEFVTCYRITHYSNGSKAPRLIFEIDKETDLFNRIKQLDFFKEVMDI